MKDPSKKQIELEKMLTQAVIAEARSWRCVMPIRSADDLQRTFLEIARYLLDQLYPEIEVEAYEE